MTTMEETLDDLIPPDQLRQMRGREGGRYRDEEQIALIKARRRGFATPEQTRAYAVIVLLGRCGMRPGPEDYERFRRASGRVSPAKRRTAGSSAAETFNPSPYA